MREDYRSDMWDRADRNWAHQRWRRQAAEDLKLTAMILAGLALIWWVATATSVFGAGLNQSETRQASTAPAAVEVWLHNGSTGDQVEQVQATLAGYGYSLKVDGIFGPVTEHRVRHWQMANGLHVDGIVGPQTWGSLSPAVRGASFQVTPVVLPPPVDHDCDSWRPIVEQYGLPWDGAEWRMRRESHCSHAFNLSSASRDKSAGVLQVNFYGYLERMWNDAGWSWEMVSGDPEAAVAAAGALYRMCGGWGPWTPPYSCGGNVLPSPAEMGYR